MEGCITLYVQGALVEGCPAVDVGPSDGVGEVKHKVAEVLGVAADDFEMACDGVWCEGDTVVVKPSRRCEAAAALKEMGLVPTAECLNEAVLGCDLIADTDATKAAITEMILTTTSNDPATFQPALHKAALLGLSQVASVLLTHGTYPNYLEDGVTPLYTAAEQGHLDTMHVLLANGAFPSLSSTNSWTPLHVAANNRRAAAIKLLLDAGASPCLKDRWLQTPLDIATGLGCAASVAAFGGV
eukprot:TRINITY_DN43511_c0_g1_i1.p1 TRINITY_DN43511_c0_g1~~TRINITY_DN43511_c0_g1_i1.p1  ORF type:complete len:265 (+),score=58.20 TRINITY_DN43511_c0_g1_i1:72-797(+)